MSKFKDFYKKIFKKKTDQDLNDEFEEYEEYEEIVDEGEIDSEELGDETVIFDGVEVGDELVTHEAKIEPQLPTDENLKYPEQKEENSTPPEDVPPPFEQKLEETIVEDFNEAEPIEEELALDEEETIEEDEILTAEEEVFEDEYEDELDSDLTSTDTIDLEESNISMKDRFDHLKLRVSDQFRRFQNKEIKPSSKLNLTNPNLNLDLLKHSVKKVNWSKLPIIFFSKQFEGNIHRFYQIALILTFAYSTPKIVGLLISGSPNYTELTKKNYLEFNNDKKFSHTELEQIDHAKIFQTQKLAPKDAPKKPKVIENKICSSATKKSSSRTTILSTIVLQNAKKSIAFIKDGKSEKGVRQGEKISSNLKVDKIERLKLIVRNMNSGECEYIEAKEKSKKRRGKTPTILSKKASKKFIKKKPIAGIKNDGNNFDIDKKFLQSKLKDMNSILKQARGIPIRNPDGTLSFKIVEIETGGVFDYLGINDSDIITQINGNSITDMTEVMNYLGKISSLSKLNLTIKRNGDEITQNYNIK